MLRITELPRGFCHFAPPETGDLPASMEKAGLFAVLSVENRVGVQ